mgnify:FL=1
MIYLFSSPAGSGSLQATSVMLINVYVAESSLACPAKPKNFENLLCSFVFLCARASLSLLFTVEFAFLLYSGNRDSTYHTKFDTSAH